MLTPAAMRGHFRVLRRIGPRIVRPLGLGHGVVQTSVRWVARRDWVVTPVVDRGHDSRVQCAFLKLGQKAGPAIGSNHLNGRGDLRGRVTQFAMVHRPLDARGGIVQQTRKRIVGIAAEKEPGEFFALKVATAYPVDHRLCQAPQVGSVADDRGPGAQRTRQRSHRTVKRGLDALRQRVGPEYGIV